MKLKLKAYDYLPCETNVFEINGKEAESDDFGGGYDEDENPPDYCCGNRVWEANEPTDKILKKYKITKREYEEIADKLEELLSVGGCCLCE